MQSSTSAPGAPRRAESRGRPLHVASVVIGASLWMTVAGNAALWAVAYAAYLWRYTPLLCAPRPDGQPG